MSAGPGAWTSPSELRERMFRRWNNGSLPASVIGGPAIFPLHLNLRGPSSAELALRFDEARKWIASLGESAASPGYRLEAKEIDHRQLGRNSLPVAAVFETPEDALAFLGKRREASRLVRLARDVRSAFPSLDDWVLGHPLVVLEREADWPALLATLRWFQAHPRSGLYARQIDAPGVHSKFVEGNRGLLSELLDAVLPPEAIDTSASGATSFAARYGLRHKPHHQRFRVLDPDLELSLGLRGGIERSSLRIEQLSLLAEDFARLVPARGMPELREVFITENEINFLSFPDMAGSLIVFGAGYGFSALARADWLHACRIRYWGDLDTHGFAILDQLRADFPETESLLMDRATLLAHRELWTTEATPTKRELARLRPDELELYDELRYDRLAPALRLEQERVGFSWVESRLRLS